MLLGFLFTNRCCVGYKNGKSVSFLYEVTALILFVSGIEFITKNTPIQIYRKFHLQKPEIFR